MISTAAVAAAAKAAQQVAASVETAMDWSRPAVAVPHTCAVNALVEKKASAAVMDELERIGATDILTTGLLSSRMGD